MQQAFSGIRILDFTQVLAGPFATQQLAQLGADVIKIEEPNKGDMTRAFLGQADGFAPSFLTCNLGKRSVAIDLKHPQADEVIKKLVATADCLVENFKPGTMERLGFGYEAMRAIKPDLIYASISGYGQEGPKSHLPAFDGAIQAASGMISVSGHEETGPVRTGYFAVDMSTALNAAFSISAALMRRQITGEGQRIDVSMLDTALMMLAPQMTGYFVTGNEPELMGNRSPTKQPTANVFATSDGFIQIVALKDSQIDDLFNVLGEPEFMQAYDGARARVEAFDEISAFLKPIFAAKPSAYWLEVLTEGGVPVAEIRSLSKVAEDDQLDHRLSIAEITHPQTGESVGVVSASHVSAPAPPTVQRPPPGLGEHSFEVLAELGYSASELEAMAADALIQRSA